MKVIMQQAHIDAMNRHLSPATLGYAYPGNVFDGLANGLATGFQGDALLPEALGAGFVPTRNVVASAGGDLAAPVAYWFQKHPLRLRVGSTGAGAVPATSGLVSTISERPMARGVLRMALADVNAAAQITLDQRALNPIPCAANKVWDVCYHVANVSNGDILSTAGFADFGVIEGAADADPANVIATNAAIFKITGNKIQFVSVATTETVIATRSIPRFDFILRLHFDPDSRLVNAFIDNDFLGSYRLPDAVTAVGVGGRVAHLAAYAAATDAPLGVDLDAVIVNTPVVLS